MRAIDAIAEIIFPFCNLLIESTLMFNVHSSDVFFVSIRNQYANIYLNMEIREMQHISWLIIASIRYSEMPDIQISSTCIRTSLSVSKLPFMRRLQSNRGHVIIVATPTIILQPLIKLLKRGSVLPTLHRLPFVQCAQIRYHQLLNAFLCSDCLRKGNAWAKCSTV